MNFTVKHYGERLHDDGSGGYDKVFETLHDAQVFAEANRGSVTFTLPLPSGETVTLQHQTSGALSLHLVTPIVKVDDPARYVELSALYISCAVCDNCACECDGPDCLAGHGKNNGPGAHTDDRSYHSQKCEGPNKECEGLYVGWMDRRNGTIYCESCKARDPEES